MQPKKSDFEGSVQSSKHSCVDDELLENENGAFTMLLAGKSPHIRSYTVYRCIYTVLQWPTLNIPQSPPAIDQLTGSKGKQQRVGVHCHT